MIRPIWTESLLKPSHLLKWLSVYKHLNNNWCEVTTSPQNHLKISFKKPTKNRCQITKVFHRKKSRVAKNVLKQIHQLLHRTRPKALAALVVMVVFNSPVLWVEQPPKRSGGGGGDTVDGRNPANQLRLVVGTRATDGRVFRCTSWCANTWYLWHVDHILCSATHVWRGVGAFSCTFLLGNARLKRFSFQTHAKTCDNFRFCGMDCFGTYLTHAQTCDNVCVQCATEWAALVHILHMSQPVRTFLFRLLWKMCPLGVPKMGSA